MDKRETTQAANALIGWFNSQDISSVDAELIMIRVQAKLITKRLERDKPEKIKAEIDQHLYLLSHEMLDVLYQRRREA
jgi:hypothetical protein